MPRGRPKKPRQQFDVIEDLPLLPEPLKAAPRPMKFKDFKIGEYFYTENGRFLCYDIGTKTILAIKDYNVELPVLESYIIVLYGEDLKNGCSKKEFK